MVLQLLAAYIILCIIYSTDYYVFGPLGMMEDNDDDSFGEVFGQRHPPLSIYIKGILERYPDGQIFKVRNSQLCRGTL